MKNNPLVTIIIPAYNVEEYIVETLESLVGQSYKNIEIFVVNDGSTDNTAQRAESVIDSRIKVLHKPNGGASSARNYPLERCKGELITFVDGDDVVSPDLLEKLIPLFDEPTTDVVVYPVMLLWGSENPRILKAKEGVYTKKADQYRWFLTGNFTFSSCNKIYRRQFFDDIRFNESVLYEDIIFWADCLRTKNLKIASSDHGLYYYRYRDTSFVNSKSSPKKINDLLNNSLTFYRDATKTDVKKSYLLVYYMSIIDDAVHAGLFNYGDTYKAILRKEFPSKFKIFLLRFCLKISSRRYKLYKEFRERIFL